MDPLRTLDMSSKALFTACLPHSKGVLDDHFESWFITSPTAVDSSERWGGDDLGSVFGLPNSTEWLDPPSASGRLATGTTASGSVASGRGGSEHDTSKNERGSSERGVQS
jgi:hypothetical protein